MRRWLTIYGDRSIGHTLPYILVYIKRRKINDYDRGTLFSKNSRSFDNIVGFVMALHIVMSYEEVTGTNLTRLKAVEILAVAIMSINSSQCHGNLSEPKIENFTINIDCRLLYNTIEKPSRFSIVL